MVNKVGEQNLEKIKELIASAKNAREKAMYEGLLHKAAKQFVKVAGGEAEQEEQLKKSDNSEKLNKKASGEPVEMVAGSEIVEFEQSSTLLKNSTVVEEQTPQNKEVSGSSTLSSAMFQAVGVIEGRISVEDLKQLRITLGNQKYRLGYTHRSRNRDYLSLIDEISIEGSKIKKISVYPQVNYNSNKGSDNSAYEISFNLVSVEKPSAKENQKIAGIFGQFSALEFQISGYWQYVAFCSCPCITVMRNYSEKRAKKVKKVGSKKAKLWLKPHHIPVEWLISPPEPFKYDSKLDKKAQMPRLFVQVKVKFEPGENKFKVIEQIDKARTKAPRCLKG